MLPLWRDADSSVRIIRPTELQEIASLVSLFERVADEEKWLPDGALQLWLDRSVYFALEIDEEVVGGIQLVLPNATGTLPCQNVWPEISLRPSGRCAHVAILALDKSVRGQSFLLWRLVVELWRFCVGSNISTFFLEVTPRVLPIYQRLGWPLKIEGQLREHWGEDCYCCSLGIPEVAESMLRRAGSSSYYQQVIAQAFRVTLPAFDVNRTRVAVKEGSQIYAAR